MRGLGCLSSNLRVDNIEIGRVISKRPGIRKRYGLDSMVCSVESESRFPSLVRQIICHESMVHTSVTKDEHAIDAREIFLGGWGVFLVWEGWLVVGEVPVSVPFLGRSEVARTPKATAAGIAMFDIGVILVPLLETGLVCPPVYGLGGGMGPLVVGT